MIFFSNRSNKAFFVKALAALCLCCVFCTFLWPVGALAQSGGEVIFDFVEEDESEPKNLTKDLDDALEVFTYFNENYKDQKIEEDLGEDLEKFLPNASPQKLYETETRIRNSIKLYRFANHIIDNIKAKILTPAPPPLVVEDDEYETGYNQPYIESDQLVVIEDFKKVISYSHDPKEIKAYLNRPKAHQKQNKKSEFQKFIDMFSGFELKKLPFYDIIYENPITGTKGGGKWVEQDGVSARLLSFNSTVNLENNIKGVINFKLPDATAVLGQQMGDFERIKIDFSKSKNLKNVSIFYPLPVRNTNLSGEQIVGYSGVFALPFVFEVSDITQPVELEAKIEISLCGVVECKKMSLSPQLVLAPGEGYSSTYANYVTQAFNNLPKMDSDDIKLRKAVVLNSHRQDEPQTLLLEFDISGASKKFDVFVSAQSHALFDKPIINIDGKKVIAKLALKEKDQDIRGKEISILAGLDYGQSLQAIVIPAEDPVFEGLSKKLTLSMMIMAFWAGLLCNLMPSVFPLFLSVGYILKKQFFKVIVGIVTACLIAASVIIGLSAFGYNFVYGLQLTSPWVVTILLFLVIMELLYLSKILAFIPRPFVMGLLSVASVLIYSFSALSNTIGFALMLGTIETVILLILVALGLSVPWLIIGLIPKIQYQNANLVKFCKGALCLSVFWLLYVIEIQSSWGAVGRIVLYFAVIVLLILFYKVLAEEVDKQSYSKKLKQQAKQKYSRIFALVIGLLLLVGIGDLHFSFRRQSIEVSELKLSVELVQDYLKRNYGVLVAIEAKWCTLCHYNDVLLREDMTLGALLKQRQVKILYYNWDENSQDVIRFMDQFERRSVPSYILFTPLYPGGVILPELFIQREMETLIKDTTTPNPSKATEYFKAQV